MCRLFLYLAILATAFLFVECAIVPVEERRRPKTWNPLCARSTVAKGLRKRKCADDNAHAHCSALMQVCNSTWANMTGSSTLETRVNMMGDIMTSMIMLMEDMYTIQLRLNLTVEHLSAAAAQTSTQVNVPTFTPAAGSPPSSAACTTWNTTESFHTLVFFTVKNFGAPTLCSNAIADAFITQLAADYKANVDECSDSNLLFGMKLSGTPVRGTDYGCEALPSATDPFSAAFYYAQITPLSHHPCAGDSLSNILDQNYGPVCGGPFANTCSKLASMTSASASVVQVSHFIIRDGSPCTQCLTGQTPSSSCYPRGKTWL